jgi:lipoprotein-anchoring transpeptidase ErfK/SrfK
MLTDDQQRDAAEVGGFAQTPRSLLRVRSGMRYGEFVWNDDNVPAGPVSIRIDLRTQLLSAFRAGHEVGTAVILFGADSKPTPMGTFPILWKGKDHQSSLYDAPMPFTLRLTGDGVAIHGSDVRWGAATHGCIGVPTDFARHLYGVAKVGDPVVVLRSTGISRPA